MSVLYNLPPGSPLSLSPSPSNSPTSHGVSSITQGIIQLGFNEFSVKFNSNEYCQSVKTDDLSLNRKKIRHLKLYTYGELRQISIFLFYVCMFGAVTS